MDPESSRRHHTSLLKGPRDNATTGNCSRDPQSLTGPEGADSPERRPSPGQGKGIWPPSPSLPRARHLNLNPTRKLKSKAEIRNHVSRSLLTLFLYMVTISYLPSPALAHGEGMVIVTLLLHNAGARIIIHGRGDVMTKSTVLDPNFSAPCLIPKGHEDTTMRSVRVCTNTHTQFGAHQALTST